MRDMVFVSHANPEDNEFTLWLSLQLAREGYPVWCDLTKLLGGEAFWKDIEHAIRERTTKFLYVLSRVSNEKPGPLDELQVARNVERDHGLHDFIVPLLIDDLPPRNANIRVASLSSISFCPSWAGGLAKLLQKLQEEGVERRTSFAPTAVAAWWREHFGAGGGVSSEPEVLVSNWFPLRRPPLIYFHELQKSGLGKIDLPPKLPFPAVQHEQYLVAFAKAASFDGCLGADLSIRDTQERLLDPMSGSGGHRLWSFKQENNAVTSLLRQAWRRMLENRSLPTHSFANRADCFYFRKDSLPSNRIEFRDSGGTGEIRHRQVVGFKTLKAPDGIARGLRYWHFGLEAKPLVSPVTGFVIKPHVLFSDDGTNIWESKERLHRARRSQCRNWWNDDWRDRIIASMQWLAASEGAVSLPVGPEESVEVLVSSVAFSSPVSYQEPNVVGTEDDSDDDEGDDEETVDESDDGQ